MRNVAIAGLVCKNRSALALLVLGDTNKTAWRVAAAAAAAIGRVTSTSIASPRRDPRRRSALSAGWGPRHPAGRVCAAPPPMRSGSPSPATTMVRFAFLRIHWWSVLAARSTASRDPRRGLLHGCARHGRGIARAGDEHSPAAVAAIQFGQFQDKDVAFFGRDPLNLRQAGQGFQTCRGKAPTAVSEDAGRIAFEPSPRTLAAHHEQRPVRGSGVAGAKATTVVSVAWTTTGLPHDARASRTVRWRWSAPE